MSRLHLLTLEGYSVPTSATRAELREAQRENGAALKLGEAEFTFAETRRCLHLIEKPSSLASQHCYN
jgi:hypothetical protein